MENKQPFVGFVGGSYVDEVQRFNCEDLINYYVEIAETGKPKGDAKAVLIGTPGLRSLQTIGVGPIRGVWTISNQELSFVVSGNEIYQLAGANAIPVQITGNLNTTTGTVQMSDNGIQLIIVDGVDGYYVTIGETTLNTIVDDNFHPTKTITFQDTLFIGVEDGTQGFFTSAQNSIDFPALNENFAIASPDILQTAISNFTELYLLGARSIEIDTNSGTGTNPFVRQPGKVSQIGCAAPYSAVIIADSIIWLGSNLQGVGMVYMLDNGLPTRVSTHAIETYIQDLGDISGATAFSYQQQGHFFYVLNIPAADSTLVFDLTEKLWHKRQSTINGVTGRWLGENHCVLNGIHIIGDYRNGNVYELDLNYYKDGDNNIQRIRVFPHSSENLNMIFYTLLEIDWQSGVGLDNNGSNPQSTVDPKSTLYMSRDGGQTWGNPISCTIGKMGRYGTRNRFGRLGSSRDMVFKIVMTEPVRAAMLSAYLCYEVGTA